MGDLVNLWGESGRSIINDDTSPTLTLKNIESTATTGGSALQVEALGTGPTLNVIVSGTSGTTLKLNNLAKGYVSTNSLSTISYAMRVDIGGVIFYMPVYLGVEIA